MLDRKIKGYLFANKILSTQVGPSVRVLEMIWSFWENG